MDYRKIGKLCCNQRARGKFICIRITVVKKLLLYMLSFFAPILLALSFFSFPSSKLLVSVTFYLSLLKSL